MPTRVVVVVGVLATIGLARAPVSASPAPPLVVLSGPGDAAATTRARQALTSASRRRGSAVIDLTSKKPAPAQARLILSRAIDAYVNLQYDKAIKQLTSAIAEANRTGARGLTTTGVSDLFMYRGLAYTQQGNASKAWEDFVHAASIAPTRTLDPVRFPPRAVETFARAVKATSAKAPATLTLAVQAGCAAWLNGRRVTAGHALQVVRGGHFVRVNCPGRVPFGAKVNIQQASHTLTPKLLSQQAPTRQQVTALAKARGARTVLFASVGVSAKTPATLLLRLLRVDTGAELDRVFAPLVGSDVSARVRAAVDRLIDRVVTPTVVAKPITIRVDKPVPWYRRGWFWGITSAVITAAVLTPLLLDRGNTTQSDFDLKPGGALPW